MYICVNEWVCVCICIQTYIFLLCLVRVPGKCHPITMSTIRAGTLASKYYSLVKITRSSWEMTYSNTPARKVQMILEYLGRNWGYVQRRETCQKNNKKPTWRASHWPNLKHQINSESKWNSMSILIFMLIKIKE